MNKIIPLFLTIIFGIFNKATANKVTLVNLTEANYTITYYTLTQAPILTLGCGPYSNYTTDVHPQNAVFCRIVIHPVGRPVNSGDIVTIGIGLPYMSIPNSAQSISTYPFLGYPFFRASWTQVTSTDNASLVIY